MFTIYSDKDIFENIVSSPDIYPNWNKIINNHSDIGIDINQNDLDSELIDDQSILFLFLQSNAREINIIASDDYFRKIDANPEAVIEKPRSVFFLNIDAEKAMNLQIENGIIVQAKSNIDDTALSGSYFKDLPKNTVCESSKDKGWKSLINFNLPPSNSLIISDNYLFKNEENRIITGEPNTINLIDAILPSNLNVTYHVLIVAEDNKKSDVWCENLKDRISTKIKSLRPYNIIVEFLFAVTIHKRIILSNYLNGSSDKGFAVFSPRDNKTVRDDNDFRLDRVFNNLHSFGGDVEFTSKENALKAINKKSKEVYQYLQSMPFSENRRIVGDCNPDYSINNRLLNDI